jgi:hypothetical protein
MATKKPAVKKSTIKKAPAKKAVAKKAPIKKKAVKKTPAKKTTTPKALPVIMPSVTLSTPHIISREAGMVMAKSFANKLSKNILQDKTVLFFSGREFSRTLFEQLLALPGCVQLRFYNAVNSNNEHTLVITGVDKDENDIYFDLKNNSKKEKASFAKLMAVDGGTDTNAVGNMGGKCPDYDDATKSLLN